MPSECPTPDKAAWTARAAAVEAMKSIKANGWTVKRPTRAYHCSPGCGRWHLSSPKKGCR